MNIEEFIYETKKMNIEITEKKLEKLEKYYNLLKNYNKKVNLTRIIEKEDVYLKHFYDSLTLFLVHDLNQKLRLCDVGSGAGLPGVVLSIFFPTLEITMLDSSNKKIEFLNFVIKELNLKNVEALSARAEEFAIENRDRYDVVTARAVSSLNILLELCIPLTKVNGCFIAMKGKIGEELTLSKKALNLTGKRNGMLVAVEDAKRVGKQRSRIWKCRPSGAVSGNFQAGDGTAATV